MNIIKNGYKLIAVVSLSYALFSCSNPVESQSNSEILAMLTAMDAKIDAMNSALGQVQTAVQAAPAGTQACSIQEVVDQNFTDCDETKIPEEVVASTTYCIAQERAGEIGGKYAISLDTEIDIGAGWPNVVWGKLTAKMDAPVPSAIGVPFPSEIAAGGSISLGRGLEICVDIPITALESAQVAQIHDLVRGVNEGQGTYSRRTGRLLNYAARRTPVAVATKTTVGTSSKLAFEDADDSFDIADAAIEKLISGEFQPIASGPGLFQDQVFLDLISALDVPTPALDTILDPERLFEAMTVIGQSSIANTCARMGITATSRARSPALDNQCARFGLYPNIQAQWDAAAFVRQARDRVNGMYTASGLRGFMCSNIALAIFSPNC